MPSPVRLSSIGSNSGYRIAAEETPESHRSHARTHHYFVYIALGFLVVVGIALLVLTGVILDDVDNINTTEMMASLEGKSGGRIGPASLDLDTTNCSSTFNTPVCLKRTKWYLDKTTAIDSIQNPNADPYSFTVTVTEGPTTSLVSGSSTVIISNSGSQTVQLSSVVVILEKEHTGPGQGNAPGPSGNNFDIVALAQQSKSAICNAQGKANTCYGSNGGSYTAVETGSSTLIIYNLEHNDVLSLNDFSIPPVASQTDPCPSNVTFIIDYSFDVSGVINSLLGKSLRVDLLATFVAGGSRGGVCETDADCNGVISTDEKYVRTVQQRGGFTINQCYPTCAAVVVNDDAATASSCVTLQSGPNNADGAVILATGTSGTVHAYTVNGTATCSGGTCTGHVVNTADLSGAGCIDAVDIFGSPSSAQFDVLCQTITPPPEGPDGFCTYTQGGWGGQLCPKQNGPGSNDRWNNSAANPDCLRDYYILTEHALGCTFSYGLGGYSALFNGEPGCNYALLNERLYTYIALEAGTPGHLTDSVINPVVTSARNLGAQLATSKLNYFFSMTYGTTATAWLTYAATCSAVNAVFHNQKLSDVILAAEYVVADDVSTGPAMSALLVARPDLSAFIANIQALSNPYSAFTQALDVYNNEYDNCNPAARACFYLQ